MVTTDALKLLYKKLGGSADVDNITAISDMVDLIEDVAGEGGGGASGLVVTVTYTYDDSSQTEFWSLDKNYTEILTVVNNGLTPIFVEELDGGNVGYHTLVESFVSENPETGDTTYGIILHAYYTTGVLTVLAFSSTSLTGELIGQILTD